MGIPPTPRAGVSIGAGAVSIALASAGADRQAGQWTPISHTLVAVHHEACLRPATFPSKGYRPPPAVSFLQSALCWLKPHGNGRKTGAEKAEPHLGGLHMLLPRTDWRF